MISASCFYRCEMKIWFKYCFSTLAIVVIVFFVNEFSEYSSDHSLYLKRKELIEACALTDCDDLFLLRYSIKGFYNAKVPLDQTSPHTRLVLDYYGIDECKEQLIK